MSETTISPTRVEMWRRICRLHKEMREDPGRCKLEPDVVHTSESPKDFEKCTAFGCGCVSPNDPDFYKWMPLHLRIGEACGWKVGFHPLYDIIGEKHTSSLLRVLTSDPLPSRIVLLVGSFNTRVFNDRLVAVLEQALKKNPALRIIAAGGPDIMVTDDRKNGFIEISDTYSDRFSVHYIETRTLPVHATIWEYENEPDAVHMDYRYPHYEFTRFRSSVLVRGQARVDLLLDHLSLGRNGDLGLPKVTFAKLKEQHPGRLLPEKELTSWQDWFCRQFEPAAFEDLAMQYLECPWPEIRDI